MKFHKLFGLLVLGGAVIGAPGVLSCGPERTNPPPSDGSNTQPKAKKDGGLNPDGGDEDTGGGGGVNPW